jgi:hypothetical protein
MKIKVTKDQMVLTMIKTKGFHSWNYSSLPDFIELEAEKIQDESVNDYKKIEKFANERGEELSQAMAEEYCKEEIKEDKKCPCANLQNGDIVSTDEGGRCVVCGKQFIGLKPKEEQIEKLQEENRLLREILQNRNPELQLLAKDLVDAVNRLNKQK